jgi:hypothetical protein
MAIEIQTDLLSNVGVYWPFWAHNRQPGSFKIPRRRFLKVPDSRQPFRDLCRTSVSPFESQELVSRAFP